MSTSTTLAKTTSIAIGGFDGMHIGHQKLFSELDDHGVILVIETGHANMTYGMLRQKYTKHLVHIYQLDSIKHLDDKTFVSRLLKDFPNLEKIVVGYDFYFGKDRAYSREDLEKHFKGDVKVVEEVKYNELSVHSHVIRGLLARGELTLCRELLGRDYSVMGSVIKGQGLGKKSLFATLNVATKSLLPKEGVYASLTRINDEMAFHESVTFLGHRLTTDGKMALETHLLDAGDMDVESIEIVFIHYVRENKKFDDLMLLKEAISKDIRLSRNYLKQRRL